VTLGVFFAVFPAMAVPRRKKDFDFCNGFLFSERPKTENQKPNFLFWYDHSNKVRDLGIHMHQSASKSARTVAGQKPAKLGSLF